MSLRSTDPPRRSARIAEAVTLILELGELPLMRTHPHPGILLAHPKDEISHIGGLPPVAG